MLDRIPRQGWQSVRAAAQLSCSSVRTPLQSVTPSSLALASSSSSGHAVLATSRHQHFQKIGSSGIHSQRRCLHFSHDFANRPGPSSQLTRTATPLDEITRLRELINRTNATNSKLSKERILAEFDDLVPLLAFLYDPYTRLHVTSSTVHSYFRQRNKDVDWQNNQAPLISVPSNRSRDRTRAAALRAKQEEDVREQIPTTLLELFQLLASRQITGHEALAVIRTFLDRHGIVEQHEYALSGFDDPNISTTELFRRGLLRPTALEIFYRCLDRNLKAGFGERILRQAFSESLSSSPGSAGKSSRQQKNQISDAPIPFRGSFEVALGRTVTRAELPSLFAGRDEAPKWYASRKLDGVRCLFVVRLRQDEVDDGAAEWKVASILALSRNGRPFSSLAVLERDLARLLPSYPGLDDLLGSAQGSASQEDGDEASSTATLVLDGEVCILRPPESASKSAIKQLDGILSSSEASQGSSEQTMVEDFAAVVGLIKCKNYIIPEPAFFPFDLLTLEEFTQWRSPATSRTFVQRLATLESLVSFFEGEARKHQKQPLIRKLSQHHVSCTDEVESLLATASQRGWEGLVLRQDTPYEGKRTSAIRKFKEWKDAEYTVQEISVATMRLPIDGIFEEREAMASIQIEHRGTKVSVGSGFTPEQRVEFAREPERIVGKVVTVEYFDESKTGEEGQNEVYSLRFPRIKQIWGKERDI
ncbi:uncharacterized protein UTRI_01170_B [Ustilago trichophora]|uniref:DNA ligase OB-like domain-containing protein n=1 Tax=Ustilago trichophora TaxID=86804 RepID=A0A5C3DWF5_9BASI|nr:uncharacterized protein UTRI_01170_B [Ustilago trichophora]